MNFNFKTYIKTLFSRYIWTTNPVVLLLMELLKGLKKIVLLLWMPFLASFKYSKISKVDIDTFTFWTKFETVVPLLTKNLT